MIDRDRFALILTGCIAPNSNTGFLTISSYSERLKQYRDSILWAIDETDVKYIIYSDNSGFEAQMDLIERASLKNKELEWLSFKGDTENVVKYGKGYGEGEILDYIMQNSKLIRKVSYFCKLTGRVRNQNITKFLNMAKMSSVYLITTKMCFQNRFKQIDTRFYGMPVKHYLEYYLRVYKSVNDSERVFLENCFYDQYIKCHDNSAKLLYYPDIRGVSGSTGTKYDIPQYKILIKALCCRLGFFQVRDKSAEL